MRKDVYIYNEATGWVITSASLNGRLGRPIEGDADWLAEFERGTFIPISLRQDDPLTARVVVNEELTPQEEEEWVDRFEWKLAVPDGRLVLCGGREYVEEGDLDHLAEYGAVVEVPPGDYRVEVYTHFPSPNSDLDEEEDMSAWWRRTRKRGRRPAWLRDEDWEDGDDGEYLMGHVIRLSPLVGKPERPPREDGWVPYTVHRRVPAQCPRGLLSSEVAGLTDRPDEVPTGLSYVHDVPALVADLEPVPITGGPVEIPVARLVLPYWLAWFCGETHPCVRISGCPQDVSIPWPGFSEGIQETPEGDGWRVDIEGMNARWTPFGHLRLLGGLLAALPDGVRLELAAADDQRAAADEDEDEESKNPRDAGLHRYVGTVTGGIWRIEATYPGVDADALRDMLALASEADMQEGFLFRDRSEVARLLEDCKQDFLLRDSPPKVRGDRLILNKADAHLTPFLGAWIYLARFGTVWPAIGRADEIEAWDNAMDAIAEAGARWATGETILEGCFARFTRADASRLKEPPLGELDEVNREMAGLGFQPLGDLNSTQTFAALFRGYGHENSRAWGALIANGWGSLQVDFYTRFASGASLTTSRGPDPGATADRRSKVYRLTLPRDASLEQMLGAHSARCVELTAKLGEPHQAAPALAEFAAALDEFMVRSQ